MDASRINGSVNRRRRIRPSVSTPEWNVVAALAVPFLAVDDHDYVFYLNAAAKRLLGGSIRRSVGRHWSEVVKVSDGTNQSATITPSTLLSAGMERDGKIWYSLRRDDGSTIPVQLSIAPLGTSFGTVPHAIGVVLHDQSAVQRLVERLTHRCEHDDLTGLVNRGEFEKRLVGAVRSARLGGHSHVLCFMDLNEFKAVNDRHGHLAGDEVLQHVANRFRSLIRERDTLARLGGDEFALLLEHCTVEHALHTARLMRFTLKQSPPIWKEARVSVGISIGITPINQCTVDFRTALATADAACYAAKREGYDSICVFSSPVLAGDAKTRGQSRRHQFETRRI